MITFNEAKAKFIFAIKVQAESIPQFANTYDLTGLEEQMEKANDVMDVSAIMQTRLNIVSTSAYELMLSCFIKDVLL